MLSFFYYTRKYKIYEPQRVYNNKFSVFSVFSAPLRLKVFVYMFVPKDALAFFLFQECFS